MILADEQEGRLRAEQGSDGPPSLALAQNKTLTKTCVDAGLFDLPNA
jgi:hypothetical protein